MPIKSYEDLIVWQKAMDLVEATYRASLRLPLSERFELRSQIRRSADSIPANIAEGHGRSTTGDYVRHLLIARGSLMELETHLSIAVRLGFLPPDDVKPLRDGSQEIGRMLSGLIRALQRRRSEGTGRAKVPAPRSQLPDPDPPLVSV